MTKYQIKKIIYETLFRNLTTGNAFIKVLTDVLFDKLEPYLVSTNHVAGSEPIKGQVTCQECGTKVDIDDAESVYNAELDDVSFYCRKCTEEEIE